MSYPTVASASSRAVSPDPSSHAANIYDQEEYIDAEDGEDDMDFEPTDAESDLLDDFEDAMEQNEPGDDAEGELDYEEQEEEDDNGAEDDLENVRLELTTGQHDGTGTTRLVQGLDRMRRPIRGISEYPVKPPSTDSLVSQLQLLRLLGHVGLRRQATIDIDDDDNEDDDGVDNGYGGIVGRRRRRLKNIKAQLPPVPNPEGKKLMDSGLFGSNEYYQDILRQRKQRLGRKLMSRELGVDQSQLRRDNQLISQGMIPSSRADTILHYDSRCYSGQFSDDGNFFFSCAQDFKVRMYDASNPYDWKYYKTVNYYSGRWTITDASLSPDNKYLAYSSISSTVSLAATDPNDESEPTRLNFTDMADQRSRGQLGGYSDFGIWSVRFSGDGRELVAGAGDYCVYVYDLETQKSILRIPGHIADVNAVCFSDKSSPHILYSGSDDSLIKVWDRRSMGDSREAGVFVGHTEGITYVDSKGDGRYVLSNGKDQSMKLWDLRKMTPTEKASQINHQQYMSGFDYRIMSYSEEDLIIHPQDCSVVTFRGHRVLQTLIRCHFSPPGSTNSRYVYSGSADGSVYIYNLDATRAGKVNVGVATQNSRPRDPSQHMSTWNTDDPASRGSWRTCVRDASWHPNAPVIAATSWNGWGASTGTCTIHSWNDGSEQDEVESKVGHGANHQHTENASGNNTRAQEPRRTRTRSRWVAARLNEEEE